jgi:hypothetical protein
MLEGWKVGFEWSALNWTAWSAAGEREVSILGKREMRSFGEAWVGKRQ